jgi:hypothetical protein
MKPTQLVSYLNLELNNDDRVKFKYKNRQIIFQAEECIVLIKKTVADWMGLEGDEFDLDDSFKIFIQTQEPLELTSTKTFSNFKKIPKYIQVVLSEMDHSLSSNGFHQTLAIINTDFANQKKLFYTAKVKEYFNLQCVDLTKLAVKITDENNKTIIPFEEKPSTLFLKLKKMKPKSFILRIASNDSNHVFQENTNANFRVRLNQPINFNVPTEVAVTSIMFPKHVNYHQIINKNVKFSIEVSPNVLPNPIYSLLIFQEENFQSAEKFITAFNEQIMFLFGNDIIILKENSSGNLVVGFKQVCSLRMTKFAATLFNKGSDLEEEDFYVLNGTKDITYSLGKISFQNFYPDLFFLNCNFITPVLTPDGYCKTLKIVPISCENNCELVKYESPHLDFFTVLVNDDTVLEFQLILPDNNIFPFLTNDPVLITLLFREK